MKREILLMLVAVGAAGPAIAAETGQCDSKPFTLKKPASASPALTAAAAPAPAPRPATPHKIVKAEKPKTVIGCKQQKG